jgi:hypothetical protein
MKTKKENIFGVSGVKAKLTYRVQIAAGMEF